LAQKLSPNRVAQKPQAATASAAWFDLHALPSCGRTTAPGSYSAFETDEDRRAEAGAHG